MSRSAPVKPNVLAAFTTFGDLLRYLRQQRHLTQRALALAVGYSISQISCLEHNERLPDELTLLSVFVPDLGLEQDLATVERLLALARQARGEADLRPTLLAINDEAVRLDHVAPQPAPRLTSFIYCLCGVAWAEGQTMPLDQAICMA